MRGVAILLLVLAALGLPVGLIFASQATMGAVILAVCCLMAIVARICQASAYHREMLRALESRVDMLRRA
jgi:hypothetical protein